MFVALVQIYHSEQLVHALACTIEFYKIIKTVRAFSLVVKRV